MNSLGPITTKHVEPTNKISDSAFVILLSVLVFGCTVAIWDRHLLVDDYVFRSFAHDIERDAWQPLLQSPFPLRQFGILLIANLSNAIPVFEFLVRLALGCIHFANSLLAGRFLAKLTRSNWMGQVSALAFATFFPASEATLWLSQACSHGLGTTMFLVSLNCYLASVDQPAKRRFTFSVASIVLVAVGLQFSELPFPLVGLFPLVSVYRSWGTAERMGRLKATQNGFVWLAVALTVGVVHLALFTGRTTGDMEARGGISIEPMAVLSRYIGYAPRIYWLLLNPAFGGGLTQASWSITLQHVLPTVGGALGVAVVLVAGSVWVWGHDHIGRTPPTPASTAWAVIVLGVTIMLASLTPGALLGGQILEFRMLYVTGMGCAYLVAGFCMLLRNLASRSSPHIATLSSIAAILLSCAGSIVYVGHEQIFAWRGQTDRQQIDALMEAVPPERMPETNVVFVPLGLTPTLWVNLQPAERSIDRLLFGVLEISNAAEGALRMAYRKPGIGVVTHHHWSNGLSIKALDDPQTLDINGVLVDVNSVVMFRFDGQQVVLSDELVLLDEAGATVRELSLPLARVVGASGAAFEATALTEAP